VKHGPGGVYSGYSGAVGLQSGCSQSRAASSLSSGKILALTGVRTEITRQQRLDEHWGAYQETLAARIVAVAGARKALSAGHTGAEAALRQTLVDLCVGM
jgi:hypothetical protein